MICVFKFQMYAKMDLKERQLFTKTKALKLNGSYSPKPKH